MGLFCTFTLAGHTFGVEADKVQEIIRYQHMTRVPLAPAVISGLINLRGQIVTAIDLRVRLGFPGRAADALPMNLVLCAQNGGAVSLLVDQIGDVLEVSDESFEAPPETLQGDMRRLILGAYKLPGRLLLKLDTDRAVSAEGTP
jgi:purine-binding chemotaxis protein CheW